MTEEIILKGLPKIIENAQALLDDADLLFENQRFERAYSIYQLSIEEIAKAFHLLGVILFEDLSSIDTQKSISKVFLNHKYKSGKSIGIEYFLIHHVKEINIASYEKMIIGNFEEHQSIGLLNDKKNFGLYSSLENDKIMKPSEMITFEDVKRIKSKASLRVKFGITIMTPQILRFDLIKSKIEEFDFKNKKESITSEHRKELRRIRIKYGI